MFGAGGLLRPATQLEKIQENRIPQDTRSTKASTFQEDAEFQGSLMAHSAESLVLD
jgi:hypothetical protein